MNYRSYAVAIGQITMNRVQVFLVIVIIVQVHAEYDVRKY